jgi:hypothetical protein
MLVELENGAEGAANYGYQRDPLVSNAERRDETTLRLLHNSHLHSIALRFSDCALPPSRPLKRNFGLKAREGIPRLDGYLYLVEDAPAVDR